MNVFSRIVAVVLVLIMIFLLPILNLKKAYDRQKENHLKGQVIKFVDEIQFKRHMDIKMYEEFLLSLNVTGDLYQIEIEHFIPRLTKELSNNTRSQAQLMRLNNQASKMNIEIQSDNEIECPLCNERYSRSESPWGCNTCRETLVGIEASTLSGDNKVPYGHELKLRVILIYRDGHRQMVFDGWKDDFDPYSQGEQVVNVNYTDKFNNTVSCLLNLVVLEDMELLICEKGHSYYPVEFVDECPFCAEDSETETKAYYQYKYTEEILSHLYEEEIYYLKAGDYISIKLKLKSQVGRGNTISYGGEVD